MYFHCVAGVLLELGLEKEHVTRQRVEQYVLKLDAEAQTKFKSFLQNSVARGSARELADLTEEEWFEDYRLAMENRYNPEHILPSEVYAFDDSMTWCVVFTHETTDWESEWDDPMKAAESRCCILCK